LKVAFATLQVVWNHGGTRDKKTVQRGSKATERGRDIVQDEGRVQKGERYV
jgi:hypothetical protein